MLLGGLTELNVDNVVLQWGRVEHFTMIEDTMKEQLQLRWEATDARQQSIDRIGHTDRTRVIVSHLYVK
jgi:hypothetical protein